MPTPTNTPSDPVHAAYDEGRRMGLATGALALSVVAFINLLGLEKSILAIVLATLALYGAGPAAAVLRRGRVALVIAAVHAATVLVVLAVFHDKLARLIELLQQLS